MYMSLLKLKIVIAIFIIAITNQLRAQEKLSKAAQEQISIAMQKLKQGDTVSAIIRFKNVLKLDSIYNYKCNIYMCISELQFEQNCNNNDYKNTLDEALKYGCNKEVILKKHAIFCDQLIQKGLDQYIDSTINIYTALININPVNGDYYTQRYLSKLAKNDLVGAEEDLQMAAKYGDKFAIWFLEDRERKKKIKK